MRTRTLAVLALLASLAVAAWLSLRPATAAPGTVRRQSLFAEDEVPVDRVDRVRVDLADGTGLAFERAAAGWRQSAPFPHPADPTAIREAVVLAASLVSMRAEDPARLDAAARAALGLDPPAATVTLSWPGGERAIRLGRRTVAGRGWVQVAGRVEAASVDAALHAMVLDGDPRGWRSLRVRDGAAEDVAGIEVRFGAAPGQRMELRRAAGRWTMLAPVATRADADAVRRYLDALDRAEADGFVEDSPADMAAFGLAQPERMVRLTVAGGAPAQPPALEVQVGDEVAQGAQERFARIDGRPAVVQLGARALAALFPPPASMIDPRGCDAVPADVRAVEFVPDPAAGAGAPGFSLARSRDAWELRAADADPAPADGQRARRLLAQLCEARAPAVALQPMPAGLRLGAFVLRGEGGAELARVAVGHEPDGQWALDGGDGVLRVFPAGFDVAVEAAAYAGSR